MPSTLLATVLLALALRDARGFLLADDVVKFTSQPVEMPETGLSSAIDARHAWIGLTYTASGGASWIGWRAPSTSAVDFDLGAPPFAAGTYFVSAERGWLNGLRSIWSTEDSGSTWRRQMQGGIDGVAFAGDHGWLGARHGESVQNYTTTDRGHVWQPCGRPWDLSEVAPSGSAFLLNARDGWTTVASFDKRGLPYLGGVAATHDGGCTWKVVWRDSDAPSEAVADLRFTDDKRGWLSESYGRLLETRDGGLSWRPIALPNNLRLEGARLESPSGGWILGSATRDSGICYTSDGGVTWQRVSVLDIREQRGPALYIPTTWGEGFLRIAHLRN